MAAAESVGVVASSRQPRDGRVPSLLPLVFTVLLVYLAGGFILDDYFHLERASRPFGPEVFRFAIHTEDHGIVLWPRAAPVHLEFLRPVSSLSFWLEFRLWALRAWGYHADNLLLHLGNVLLLLRLARRLGVSRAASLWLGVAWGVSLPAAPAVGWISGRTELLYTFFVLSSANAFDSWIAGGRPVWFALAALLAALAPWAKESGVVAPVLLSILPGLRARLSPGTVKRRMSPWAATVLFTPALVYLWFRFSVLQVPPPPRPYLDPLASPWDVVWLAAKPGLYLVTGLLSLPLSHVSPLSAIRQSPCWLALVVAAAVVLLRPLIRAAGLRVTALLLAWFVVGLLPYLPILPTSLYLYLPLAGLALLLGVARDTLPERRWPRRWLLGWILAGASAQLVIGVFTGTAARSLERAALDAGRICRRTGASHLVLFDTPVWAYGLPAAIRLRHGPEHLETWFVNFSPYVRPGRPSRLSWKEPLTLEARPYRGRFFDSPFEEFLLFGGSAADTLRHARSGVLTVRPDPIVDRPSRILVRFPSEAARARCALLQFRGWRIEPVLDATERSVPAHAIPAAAPAHARPRHGLDPGDRPEQVGERLGEGAPRHVREAAARARRPDGQRDPDPESRSQDSARGGGTRSEEGVAGRERERGAEPGEHGPRDRVEAAVEGDVPARGLLPGFAQARAVALDRDRGRVHDDPKPEAPDALREP